jgi:hypothetical protein
MAITKTDSSLPLDELSRLHQVLYAGCVRAEFWPTAEVHTEVHAGRRRVRT